MLWSAFSSGFAGNSTLIDTRLDDSSKSCQSFDLDESIAHALFQSFSCVSSWCSVKRRTRGYSMTSLDDSKWTKRNWISHVLFSPWNPLKASRLNCSLISLTRRTIKIEFSPWSKVRSHLSAEWIHRYRWTEVPGRQCSSERSFGRLVHWHSKALGTRSATSNLLCVLIQTFDLRIESQWIEECVQGFRNSTIELKDLCLEFLIQGSLDPRSSLGSWPAEILADRTVALVNSIALLFSLTLSLDTTIDMEWHRHSFFLLLLHSLLMFSFSNSLDVAPHLSFLFHLDSETVDPDSSFFIRCAQLRSISIDRWNSTGSSSLLSPVLGFSKVKFGNRLPPISWSSLTNKARWYRCPTNDRTGGTSEFSFALAKERRRIDDDRRTSPSTTMTIFTVKRATRKIGPSLSMASEVSCVTNELQWATSDQRISSRFSPSNAIDASSKDACSLLSISSHAKTLSSVGRGKFHSENSHEIDVDTRSVSRSETIGRSDDRCDPADPSRDSADSRGQFVNLFEEEKWSRVSSFQWLTTNQLDSFFLSDDESMICRSNDRLSQRETMSLNSNNSSVPSNRADSTNSSPSRGRSGDALSHDQHYSTSSPVAYLQRNLSSSSMSSVSIGQRSVLLFFVSALFISIRFDRRRLRNLSRHSWHAFTAHPRTQSDLVVVLIFSSTAVKKSRWNRKTSMDERFPVVVREESPKMRSAGMTPTYCVWRSLGKAARSKRCSAVPEVIVLRWFSIVRSGRVSILLSTIETSMPLLKDVWREMRTRSIHFCESLRRTILVRHPLKRLSWNTSEWNRREENEKEQHWVFFTQRSTRNVIRIFAESMEFSDGWRRISLEKVQCVHTALFTIDWKLFPEPARRTVSHCSSTILSRDTGSNFSFSSPSEQIVARKSNQRCQRRVFISSMVVRTISSAIRAAARTRGKERTQLFSRCHWKRRVSLSMLIDCI